MIPIIFNLLSVSMIGITEAQVDHDIAVTSVTPSPTSVRLGGLVNITVVVENQGTENETFDVTVYYDTTAIETQGVSSLASGANTSLTSSWNTTDVREEIYAMTLKEKTYTINATATIALDEDPDDNTLVSPSKVKVISQYIAAIPQSTVDLDLTPGKNYTISIYTDYNGTDVWGWEFSLSYNPFVLHGVKVVNGNLITNATGPSARFQVGTFDNEAGKLELTGAYFYYTEKPPPTTCGPGILANVTFTVVGYGPSDITFGKDTELLGYTEAKDFYKIVSIAVPAPGALAHLLHGFFQNTEEAVIHDIAVISVAPSLASVKLGELVNITVVVENQGTMAETFDVNIYRSTDRFHWWLVETRTVSTLAPGANETLTLVWNTTNVPKGTYTIKAVASLVSGEEDEEDNTLESDETVTVTGPETLPLPIDLIAIVVVVVAVSALAAYVLIRRRKPTPE